MVRGRGRVTCGKCGTGRPPFLGELIPVLQDLGLELREDRRAVNSAVGGGLGVASPGPRRRRGCVGGPSAGRSLGLLGLAGGCRLSASTRNPWYPAPSGSDSRAVM